MGAVRGAAVGGGGRGGRSGAGGGGNAPPTVRVGIPKLEDTAFEEEARDESEEEARDGKGERVAAHVRADGLVIWAARPPKLRLPVTAVEPQVAIVRAVLKEPSTARRHGLWGKERCTALGRGHLAESERASARP